MKILRILALILLISILLPIFAGDRSFSPPVSLTVPTVPTEPTVSEPPTTEPLPPTTTELPTEPPTTAPPPPSTQIPTVPPTEKPTVKPTKPTETDPPEPWSSQEVTIGDKISGITAKKAFVFDCETQSFLYMKSEADAKLYPASITKLMNVYTALKCLEKDDIITVDSGMLSLVPVDTSKAGLYLGEKLTVENLIKGVLVASGSDAAHILAVAAGRAVTGNPDLPAQEAEDAHVTQMNYQATVLGLVNTHFVNCDGYQNYYHYTCMADLATIAGICLNTPLIRDTVSQYQVKMTFTNGKSRTLRSTNHLLRKTSAYYRKEACGLKTGTTDSAGACLLSAFYINGRYMIIGVFGCPTYNSRYSNATKLFDRFKSYTPPAIEPEPTSPTEGSTQIPETSEIPTETQAPETSEIPTETQAPETTEIPTEATEIPTETSQPETEITAPSTEGTVFFYSNSKAPV